MPSAAEQPLRLRYRCASRALAVAFSFLLFPLVAHAAEQEVNVIITMGWVTPTDCGDFWSPTDIYFEVTVDGVTKDNFDTQIDPNIWPAWSGAEFKFEHVAVSKGSVPVSVRMWDSDSGGSEVCSFGPIGASIDFTLNLVSCAITGEVVGHCGQDVGYWGNGGGLDFRVDVVDPAYVPGLNVRCLHSPIWPSPGQQITIEAEALDGNGALRTGVVEAIEIWIDDKTKPYSTSAGTGLNTLSATYTPPAGAKKILYGCRVLDKGNRIFTGWRLTQIGNPEHGRAVPIVYTGSSWSRIDVVFIADRDDFTGPDDPMFTQLVRRLIHNGYYAEDATSRAAGLTFLRNQDAFNFWLALDMGDAKASGVNATALPPTNWWDDYVFADSGPILHAIAGLRDYANRNLKVFTLDASGVTLLPERTALHESGHVPFGLSDEYCEKGRKYFESESRPNVYASRDRCLGDPLATGIGDACQPIADSSQSCSIPNFFRVEPASTYFEDFMTGHGHMTPNRADSRAIEWLLEECRSASCE